MAAIQEELYDAFISANADERKARAAARSVAEIVTEYPKPGELATREYIDGRIEKLEERTDKKLAELEARIMRALWLQGASIIGIVIAYFTAAITIIK